MEDTEKVASTHLRNDADAFEEHIDRHLTCEFCYESFRNEYRALIERDSRSQGTIDALRGQLLIYKSKLREQAIEMGMIKDLLKDAR